MAELTHLVNLVNQTHLTYIIHMRQILIWFKLNLIEHTITLNMVILTWPNGHLNSIYSIIQFDLNKPNLIFFLG